MFADYLLNNKDLFNKINEGSLELLKFHVGNECFYK